MATMLVRHMVFKHYGQPRVPVKREELVEIVQGEYPNSKGLASQVIPIAARMCRELLGFEMVEVGSGLPASELLQQQQDQDLDSQLSQAQAQSTALASGKIFILQSTVKRELLQQYVATDDLTQDMSLRLIVCTLIQSSGGSVTEGTVPYSPVQSCCTRLYDRTPAKNLLRLPCFRRSRTVQYCT